MLAGLHRSWQVERRLDFRARRLGTAATVITLCFLHAPSQAFFVSAWSQYSNLKANMTSTAEADLLATCPWTSSAAALGALVAPPLPSLSPRHHGPPTRVPAGPKSCTPPTACTVEHAPMRAKKACCRLARCQGRACSTLLLCR